MRHRPARQEDVLRGELEARRELAHIQLRVSNEWVTPLAGPVLPDVKKITAGPAGSIGIAGPGGAAATSSNRGPPTPAPSYDASPRGSRPASRLAATSGARSAWTTSAEARHTSSAWSISRAV